MRFAVTTLDVIQDRNGSWEVNDQHQVGSIDVDLAVAEDDQLTLDVLNANGFLNNLTIEDVYFMGESVDYIQIHDEETDRPILALVLEQ
jgi:glutaredoxin 2